MPRGVSFFIPPSCFLCPPPHALPALCEQQRNRGRGREGGRVRGPHLRLSCLAARSFTAADCALFASLAALASSATASTSSTRRLSSSADSLSLAAFSAVALSRRPWGGGGGGGLPLLSREPL